MSDKLIRTKAAYEAALVRIDVLMDAEMGTPTGDELDVLVDLVELYEDSQMNKLPEATKGQQVWAEESSQMVRFERLDGVISISILRVDPNIELASATLGAWRWEQVVNALAAAAAQPTEPAAPAAPQPTLRQRLLARGFSEAPPSQYHPAAPQPEHAGLELSRKVADNAEYLRGRFFSDADADWLINVAAAIADLTNAEAENFKLAAGQCVVDGGLVGDEGGTPYCTLKAEIERLKTTEIAITGAADIFLHRALEAESELATMSDTPSGALLVSLREPIPWEPTPRSDTRTVSIPLMHAEEVEEQRGKAADTIERLAEMDGKAGWLAQIVIDKHGGTPDLQAWVSRSAQYYSEAEEKITALRERLAKAFAEVTRLETIHEELRERLARVEGDAERWEKLYNSGRVRLLGFARGGPEGRDGDIRHIGFEFTSHPAKHPGAEEETKMGRDTLVEFVDALARRQP